MPLSATPSSPRPHGLTSGQGPRAGRKPPAGTRGWPNRTRLSGSRSGSASRQSLSAGTLGGAASARPHLKSTVTPSLHPSSSQARSVPRAGVQAPVFSISLPAPYSLFRKTLVPPELLLAGQDRCMLFPGGAGVRPRAVCAGPSDHGVQTAPQALALHPEPRFVLASRTAIEQVRHSQQSEGLPVPLGPCRMQYAWSRTRLRPSAESLNLSGGISMTCIGKNRVGIVERTHLFMTAWLPALKETGCAAGTQHPPLPRHGADSTQLVGRIA